MPQNNHTPLQGDSVLTQISLSKAYAIIDEERGIFLKKIEELAPRYQDDREAQDHTFFYKDQLRLLNKLKRKFALVSDADQLPLGL